MYYLDGGDVLHSCGNQGLQFRKTLGVNVFSELVNYIWKKDKQKENSALQVACIWRKKEREREKKKEKKNLKTKQNKNSLVCIWRKTNRKKIQPGEYLIVV